MAYYRIATVLFIFIWQCVVVFTQVRLRWFGGRLNSVLAHLQNSELDVLVGLTFIVALEDHYFMVLRADSLFAGYFQHQAD